MTTGCIIQARMTSSRLPGKVLRTIDFENDVCVLEQVIERVKRVSQLDTIIVATTINQDDDEVVALSKKLGVETYRGSESDVLERFFEAATLHGLDQVMRITSDCPFLDPDILASLIDLFNEEKSDYASNCIRRTFPHGMDCEILNYDLLKWMYDNTTESFYREHVTSYVTSHQQDFRIGSLEDTEDHSGIRVTVDTVNDYILTCVLNDLLKAKDKPLSYKTLIECFEEHPYISMINSDIMQKKKYETVKEEVDAAVQLLRLQEMRTAADILSKASQ